MKLKQLTMTGLALTLTLASAGWAEHHEEGMQQYPTPATAEKPKAVKKSKKAAAAYHCPMDGYISAKPGNCPKCGMALEKVSAAPEAKATAADAVKYRCPMDGYESDKPGKCAKCGMDLEKKEEK